MTETLILVGILCVIAAIVGGGLTLASIGSIPAVDSVRRQVILAVFGVVVIAAGLALRNGDQPDGSLPVSSRPPPSSPAPSSRPPPKPTLELRPTTGRPGTGVSITGRDFRQGERVMIQLGTTELGTAKADTSGQFFNKRVRIPSAYQFAGRRWIDATGYASLRQASSLIDLTCRNGDQRFHDTCVGPGGTSGSALNNGDAGTMKLLPRTGRVGTWVSVTARGFQQGERVVISLGGSELGAVRADSRGRFFNRRVRIPSDSFFAGQDHIAAFGEVSIQSIRRPIYLKCREGEKRILNSCQTPGG